MTSETKAAMKKVLEEIQTGRFARDWVLEDQAGAPSFHAMRAKMNAHNMEEVGEKLRSMMQWSKGNQLVDRKRN